MKILSLIFFMSTLWVSALKAHELTAEFCRNVCDSNAHTGWCIPLGAGAKKIAAPFNAILAATTAGDADFKLDNCNRKIAVMGSDIIVTGSPCSLTQVGTDLELTSEFSGIVNGTIANVSGVVEVSLTGSNLKSGFKTSKYSSFGKVSFVTTHVAASGDQKVIWDNGEFCFTGFVKP